MAASDQIVPHLGRALLIHNGESDGCEGNVEEGFDYCVEDVEELLNCPDNKVTILYVSTCTVSSLLQDANVAAARTAIKIFFIALIIVLV